MLSNIPKESEIISFLFTPFIINEFHININQLPNVQTIANIPIVKKQSPTLFVNNAEIEL